MNEMTGSQIVKNGEAGRNVKMKLNQLKNVDGKNERTDYAEQWKSGNEKEMSGVEDLDLVD